MSTSAVKIPLKISCTPFHALSQSPVKTPRTKSIIPSKTAFMESQMDFTVEKKKFKISPNTPNDSDQSVVNTPCKKSSTRWRMACISSPFVAISATSPTMAEIIRTIGLAIKKLTAVVMPVTIPGITVPVMNVNAYDTALITAGIAVSVIKPIAAPIPLEIPSTTVVIIGPILVVASIRAGITVPVSLLIAPAMPDMIPATGEIAAIRPPTIRIVFLTPSSRFENQSIAF